jgi:hypothetical protein
MRLYTMPGDRIGLDPRLVATPYAVLAPTSRWPGKRWPADRFAALAKAILDDARLGAVALVAAANERDQCGPLLDLARHDNRIIDLIGHTDVGRLMAVIERSSLVVANDSAALHIAVGFGRPLLGLYGPTRTDLVGPYQHEADVIHGSGNASRLSHKDAEAGAAAMRTIDTQSVIAAALDRIAVDVRPAPVVEVSAPIIDLPHLDPGAPVPEIAPAKPRRRKSASPAAEAEPKPEAKVTKRRSPVPPKSAAAKRPRAKAANPPPTPAKAKKTAPRGGKPKPAKKSKKATPPSRTPKRAPTKKKTAARKRPRRKNAE